METLDSARNSVLAIFFSNLQLLMQINLTSHIHMKSSVVSSDLLSQDRDHTWLKKVSGDETQWPERILIQTVVMEPATFPASISDKFPTDSKCLVLWKSQSEMKSPVSSYN